MHGDAAFAGQGVVAETLRLSGLRGYRTGGTIHVIVNNQIGFTTSPPLLALGPYPPRRRQDGPGADLPRQRRRPRGRGPRRQASRSTTASSSSKDVVVDMVCYRRHGHNEGDEPAFTQPLMYPKIGAHQPGAGSSTPSAGGSEGVLPADEGDAMVASVSRHPRGEVFEAANNYKPNKADWLEGTWSGFMDAAGRGRSPGRHRGQDRVAEGSRPRRSRASAGDFERQPQAQAHPREQAQDARNRQRGP